MSVPADDSKTSGDGTLAALVGAARDAIVSCRTDGVVQTWNSGAQRMFGIAAEAMVGQAFFRIVPEATLARMQAQFAAALAGRAVNFETTLQLPPAPAVEVSAALAPICDDEGRVVAVAIILHDITRRKRNQEKNALLAAIIQHSNDAIFSMTHERVITSWNPAAERLYGYSAQEAIGQFGRLIVLNDQDDAARRAFASVVAGNPYEGEVVRRHKSGRLMHVSISHAPVRDESGVIVGVSAIHRDIGERKRHEEHMRFVMREMAHRSKNLLAIIVAMAGQTARGVSSVQDFVTRFTQRVQGLSYSHDLLLAEEWRGVALCDLIATQLAPMIKGEEWRLATDGPALFLDPKAAQNLGLALHELATNAVRHGALASRNGRIALSWDVRDKAAGGRVFHIAWSEFGVPRSGGFTHKGFGRLILERLAVRALEGDVLYEDREGGVCWTLDIPAHYVL